MREFIEESGQLESNTIGVFRTAAVVKGGKRFSFGSLVVVGDRRGRVGLGYGKAKEVPTAIEKAQKDGKKGLKTITLFKGTIPHQVEGRYSASRVRLIPASPGTGVVAGATVRAILELVGVTDCLTKAYGSTNKKNLAKATLDGLSQLRKKEDIEALRGVEIATTDVHELLKRGLKASAPKSKNGGGSGGDEAAGKSEGEALARAES